MSSSKAERQVHFTTSTPAPNPKFDHVNPSWLLSGTDGPLSPYEWQSQTDTTAAGQHDTTTVEDQREAGHDQHHNSHNSHSLPQVTQDRQHGNRDAPPPRSRITDGVYRCSECLLVFQKRHLLKYVNPSHRKSGTTLTRQQADTSGFISLPTSAHTLNATSDSVRSETSIVTLSQGTLQTRRSRMTYSVLTQDASMPKGEAEYARGRTIWPDTSARSMREVYRSRMPFVAVALLAVM